MDRRRFLRMLGGAVVTAAPVIHVLPPVGGWRTGSSGLTFLDAKLETLNGSLTQSLDGASWVNSTVPGMWASKTAAEILADIHRLFATLKRVPTKEEFAAEIEERTAYWATHERLVMR